MRRALLGISAFTLLACGWLTIMEGVLRHPGFATRMMTDSLLGATSITIALVVVFHLAAAWRWLALAGALAAGGVGLAAILRDAKSTHFEGYVLVIGAALLTQAMLAIWVLAPRPRASHA